MARVRVVTDSTADLPPDLAELMGIRMVPLNVHFGDEVLRDGVDITSGDFFDRLAGARQLPKTSAPSVGAFQQAYEQAATSDASGVLCVTISGKLSGTHNAASVAARQFETVPVRVLDSQTASTALGIVAIAAAEAAARGGSLDEVEAATRDVANHTDVLFYADTLEYLQKGGRIGRAQGLIGSILEIKPVLTVRDGEVEQYQRARTRGKAIQALIDWFAKLRQPERVSVLWSHNEADLNRLLDGLAPHYPRDQILITKYGPVIGVHVGPGAMGVAATHGRSGS